MSLRFLALPIDNVRLRQIRASTEPLRDGEEEIEALCGSISEIGLLQPIIIRSKDGLFEVIAGNRRLEACRRLRWRTIPCHIVEVSDKEAFEISIAENVERRTLDPIEEAEAFKKYVELAGWGGITELSKKIGKSPAYISKRIRLLSLPPEVLSRAFRRRNSQGILEEILSLETSEQVELSRTLEGNPVSIRQVRSMVRTIKDAKFAAMRNAKGYPTSFFEVEEEKQKRLVRCIDQVVAALRLALIRTDDSLERIEKEWVEREILGQYRTVLHTQIDSLIRFRKKLANGLNRPNGGAR